ncbi:phosphoglycerate kinase [Candidatus Wolfebacteria bacterium]|nr:phosphoglycerate kinase [Candidatus Wolfebacteria bacterium]
MKFLSSLKKNQISGKTCLLRVDLNILDKDISKDNLRVQAVLPTIKFLVKNGAKVVLMSHRGRTKKVKSKMENRKWKKELTLKPFATIFEKLLKQPVKFVDINAIFKDSGEIMSKQNRIFLLENLRFYKGEEENDKNFAKKLAEFGDFYVNDAFAVSHRENASICAIAGYLSSYAGFLFEREIKNLNRVIKARKRPLVMILGGAKISDKIGIINNFIKKSDFFLIGGGIANNFLKAEGLPIGDSIYEKDKIDFAGRILKNKKIILPMDYAVHQRQIIDIGPNTAEKFSELIRRAKTIIWNGPMGIIENPKSKKGSETIVRAVIKSRAFATVGGGETATLFEGKKLPKHIFLSTGGGAMLEYLSGEKLPGIKALNRK